MIGIVLQTSLLVVVLCLTILYFSLRRRYGYWKMRGVPYEEPTLLVGNLGGLMRISISDFMHNLGKKHKTDYVGIYLGLKPALVINSKELAKKVLVKDFDYFQNRYSDSDVNTDPLGALNLFNVKNPVWSDVRSELSPLFTTFRLKGLTESMNMNSTELVNRIQADHIENNKPVHLKELFSMYASDIVGQTVYGVKVSCLKELTSPLWAITRHMVTWTFWRGLELTLVMFVPALAKLLRMCFFSEAATRYVKQFFWQIVEERQSLKSPNDKDLLNHLLTLKENKKLPAELADNLMLAQMAVFIIGAIETSSNILTYLLHELAHHPEEQEKLYKEVSTALKKKNKDVLDYNDLMELNYLLACLKETLRKYPVVAMDRVCNRTYELTDDVTIEAGTPVLVNVMAIHYNEEYYPEPELWRPERYQPAPDNDNRDFTFLTFGEGPRACIGKRYGLMQLRSAVAHMVVKFRFEPVEPYVLETDPYSVAQGPKSGGKVTFVAR